MNDMNIDCERCGASKPVGTIVSKFNFDVICTECKAREMQHPDYKAADEAEIASVRGGDYNFPGLGAPEDLYLNGTVPKQGRLKTK